MYIIVMCNVFHEFPLAIISSNVSYHHIILIPSTCLCCAIVDVLSCQDVTQLKGEKSKKHYY